MPVAVFGASSTLTLVFNVAMCNPHMQINNTVLIQQSDSQRARALLSEVMSIIAKPLTDDEISDLSAW